MSLAYVYYGDDNVAYTDAVVDAFEAHKVDYRNVITNARPGLTVRDAIVAVAYANTPRAKKILAGLSTGKNPP